MLGILIVEDEAIIRKGIEKMIDWQSMGIQIVKSAANPRQAFSVCSDFIPDIIISDIRMPGMDGIAFCTQFRQAFPECQIIFISGFSDKEYLMAAIHLKVINYVEKPINQKELAEAIQMAVDAVLEKHPEKKAKHPMESQKVVEEAVPQVEKADAGYISKQLMCYLSEHYAEADISVQQLAEYFGYTPNYLSSLFRKQTGITIGQYLTKVRVEKAKEYLKDPSNKLYQIAEMVGYTDSHYFAKIFKKAAGMLPSEYRENL